MRHRTSILTLIRQFRSSAPAGTAGRNSFAGFRGLSGLAGILLGIVGVPWAMSAVNLQADDEPQKAATQSAPKTLPAPAQNADVVAQEASDKTTDPNATPSPGETPSLEETDEFQSAESVVRNAFEPPPGGKALSRNFSLWIDPEKKHVYADGYVVMTKGLLEMFACPMNSKEHESVIAVLAKSSQVHAALLAIGTVTGTPVRYDPEFLPATGQRVRIWVSWIDEAGKYHVADARKLIVKAGTEETLNYDWVFAGSGFWKDDDGKEYYKADAGDMVCVSNFSTAMLDLPIESSAQAGQLLYSPFTEKLPKRGTPVRLTFIPIPIPSDKPEDQEKTDVTTPPGPESLTKKKKAQ